MYSTDAFYTVINSHSLLKQHLNHLKHQKNVYFPNSELINDFACDMETGDRTGILQNYTKLFLKLHLKDESTSCFRGVTVMQVYCCSVFLLVHMKRRIKIF